LFTHRNRNDTPRKENEMGNTMTVAEAARLTGLTEPAIRWRIVKRELPAEYVGGRLRIPGDAVRERLGVRS